MLLYFVSKYEGREHSWRGLQGHVEADPGLTGPFYPVLYGKLNVDKFTREKKNWRSKSVWDGNIEKNAHLSPGILLLHAEFCTELCCFL